MLRVSSPEPVVGPENNAGQLLRPELGQAFWIDHPAWTKLKWNTDGELIVTNDDDVS